jgi:hypothetical protein
MILTEHSYMAKAPSTAASFDGSGKVWFKILDIGPTFSNGQASWDLWRMSSFPFLFSPFDYQPSIDLPAGYPFMKIVHSERDKLIRHSHRNLHVHHPTQCP